MRIMQTSLESISFQGTQFFDELIVAMDSIDQLDPKKVPDSDEEERLGNIIKHYTGMNITVSFGPHMPCISVPQVDKNNVLINNYMRNYLSGMDGLAAIQKNGGAVRGTVDMARNRVSGIFAEFPAAIHMPISMLKSKYTSRQKAAIVLHEVGHLFTYFELMARVATTNQALESMSKALDQSGSIEQREVVFMTVKQALNLPNLNEKELAKSNDKRAVEAVILTAVVQESRTQLGRSVYDSTSWEYLADQYAARCGASRDLVTALDTLYRGSWNISYRSAPAYLFMEVLKFASLAGAIFVPGGIFLAVFLFSMDGHDASYDRPGARMARIRSQIVENLKDRDLDKEDVARLEEDLRVIDNLTKEVNDRRQFAGVIWDTLIPSARKDRSYTQLQQELEEIGSNELFVKAAQLRTIAA